MRNNFFFLQGANTKMQKQHTYSGLFSKAWLMLLLLTVFVSGCKKVVEEPGKIGICPTVIATDPANGAINVVTNKKITATFSEPMDPATINVSTFLLKQGANLIQGTVSYTGVTATFTPSAPLLANTVYTGTITTGAKDPARNALVADYVWSFNTGATPTVVSTDPANGAIEVPLNKIITALFSTTMDPTTINSTTFIIKQGVNIVPGAVTYSGMTATFTPASPLTVNTVYTGTITTGAKDVAGNAMANSYVWSFATGVNPIVVSTDPPDGAKNVVLNKVITAVFNKSMDPATINATTFLLKQGATAIAGTVTYSGRTATFTPTAPLTGNTVYTGTITTGAKDSSGNALSANYVWNFTTGNSPIVISTDPPNGATNVPLTKIITANFSTAMDPATINGTTFLLKQGTNAVAGTVTYSGTTATFTPTLPLTINTVYTGTITTGAKDVAGNPLTANYVWTFTTGNPPTVISTDPSANATNVPVNKMITATFSTVMDASTINTTTFLLKQGANAIAGSVTYSGTTATFIPSSPLAPNTVYTGTITTGAKDASGIPLASNYTWSFTTSSAPTVISTDPANGATDVPLNKMISANFSTVMDPATINTSTFLLKQGATAVPGSVTYSGTTATFIPTNPLTANTVYTATITTGAKDASGNALANNYTWSFTTTILPTVTSTDPANGATNVPIAKIITATFSKAMDPATINALTFLVKQGANPVFGTVTYSGTTATFTPLANLAANTIYTGTITTGAKDAAGNALANNYVWSFTTVAVVVPPPPSILGTAALFGSFGGNAGITNQGINTVINNGSIGTTAASTLITGFHDGTTGDVYTETPLNIGLVTGRIYTAPPPPGSAASLTIAQKGLADANLAYLAISPASKPGGTDPGAGELGGLTLAPGVYKAAGGSFSITNGDLVLDGKGDPNAEWFFQAPSSLTVGVAGPAGARSVKLIGNAQARNVYWYVGTAATINGAGGGVMTGTIISSAGVTFSTAGNAVQTVLNGRALSLVASVTMVNTTINVPN